MKRRIVLRAAGIVGAAGAALALTATAAFAASQIGPGSPAAPVKCVQQAMNDLDNAGLTVDGDYGQLTTNAVVAYQSAHKLEKDGLVGPDTGGSIKTTVYNALETSIKAGDPDQTLATWENNCDSQLEGSIS